MSKSFIGTKTHLWHFNKMVGTYSKLSLLSCIEQLNQRGLPHLGTESQRLAQEM